jgi:Resolvase, N terminal domain
MTDRGSQPVGGGAPRRATPRRGHGGDSPRVVEGRDEEASPTAGESKYPAPAQGRPAPEPLNVRIELVVVDGPDAKELLKRQAAAVREALQWFADNPKRKDQTMIAIPDTQRRHRTTTATTHAEARSDPCANLPPSAAASTPVPVAWYGRVASAEHAHIMLTRQLDTARCALPPEYVIAVTFYDIGSGHLAPQERGVSPGHDADVSLARDGGLADLLAEAKRPDRRFVAVVCTSIDRLARATHLSARIEHELQQAGVALLVADEGITDRPTPAADRQNR